MSDPDPNSNIIDDIEERSHRGSSSRSSEKQEGEFQLPSFDISLMRKNIEDEDVRDDYTLDSTTQSEIQMEPVQLVHSNNSKKSSASSTHKFTSRLKKTFSISAHRRPSILQQQQQHLPKRSNTVSNLVIDIEKGETENEIEDKVVAEELVNLHNVTATSAAQESIPYLIKEEYDDEQHDVNDKFSEIPHNVQTGILSSLLKLYNDNDRYSSDSDSDDYKNDEDDARKMLNEEIQQFNEMENDEFDDLVPSKSMNELDQLRSRFNRKFKNENRSRSPLNLPRHRMSSKLNKSSSTMELPKFHKKKKSKKTKLQKLTHHKKLARARITVHIADILQRQKFILKLCKTFMLYGAPTHRIEEYLISSARVLEIDANFIYFPGCMIISFGDATTRTSEMHLVRCLQGVDLSKLHDVHDIYKKVMHDVISVDIAIDELNHALNSKPIYNAYVLILVNGLASLFITSWGFKGGWRDMPISFVLGSLVGFLQIVVSPKSNTYSSVFEVSASVVVAFLSRAFGSIGSKNVFCFSAITQSSLVAILPGYTILCGSLELQSRNIVSGAVRMFYAIIYSLFLGFGIILGSALYKWVDHDATSEITCPSDIQISDYYRIVFVPFFALTQLIIGQARFNQLPIMLFISCVTYVGYYFASLHFASSAEFSAAIGSFIVGILGNLYSRLGQGLAVSAMYPGILLLVPGSIGLKSSLSSGVKIADDIVSGTTTSSSSSDSSLSFGIAMIEVAIGLCVGLIGAALVVYPFGKKRTGLFTL